MSLAGGRVRRLSHSFLYMCGLILIQAVTSTLSLASHRDQSSSVQSRRIHLLIGVDGRLLARRLCRLLGEYTSRCNIRVGILFLASAVTSAQSSSDVIIRMCRSEGPPFLAFLPNRRRSMRIIRFAYKGAFILPLYAWTDSLLPGLGVFYQGCQPHSPSPGAHPPPERNSLTLKLHRSVSSSTHLRDHCEFMAKITGFRNRLYLESNFCHSITPGHESDRRCADLFALLSSI